MNKNIILGCHVSYKAKDYLLGSVNEALNYGANAFMIYTGPPQNFRRTEIDLNNVQKAFELMQKHNIKKEHIVVHAPYLINLASPKEGVQEFGLNQLIVEIKRTATLGSKLIVLHPGSALTKPSNEALDDIATNLNKAFKEVNNDVIVCLETMAGKGSEVGTSFSQLKAIIDKIENKKRIGVCFDTCHLNDSGLDVSDPFNVIEEFSKYLDFDYLKVIHLNDSKNELGAKKDRHANIGYGTIGFEALAKWVHCNKFNNLPIILETPYYNNRPVYKEEIYGLINKEVIRFKD